MTRRSFCLSGAAGLAAGSLRAQEAGKVAGQEQASELGDESKIVVQVSRVPLLFTVTDKKNRFITNLEKEDFEIYDNGEPQEIRQFVRESDLPLRIGILMDTSNSIRGRFRFEQEAAIEFIRGVLAQEKDRAFLVAYDTRAELMVDFTHDSEKLAEGVRSMRPGGGTALYDSIYYACRDKLPEDRPLEEFRRALVLIGDGEDNQSSVTRDMALEMAHKAEAVLYTISTNRSGMRQDGDKVLKYFAEETGGVSFHPFQATELEQSFADIANELRHQYFIIYSPTNFAMDGSFHKIKIKSNVKNAVVRARSGYYAPTPDELR
ncbi:MAG: VWA domain-containing protein [Acidobacteria bacterium]|nr:VWA domain-containing protein [Acidobacteriota bacterium]